jgi:hypothetical protein
MRRIAMYASLLLTISVNAGFAQTATEVHATPGTGAVATSSRGDNEPMGESWTELNAVKSGLDPSHVLWAVLGKSDFPDYSSELVRVQWRTNDPIDLYVVRPYGIAKPPVILYLYSSSADTDHFQQKAWCEFVTKSGFAAVGFVSALTGQRYHTRPMREWFVSELQEALGTTTHDVQMIIDYLAGRGDLDTERVGMLGEGSGGTIAILSAAADPRIEFVDAINPWGDWPDWLKESRVVPDEERANYLRPEFLQKVVLLDPVNYLPHLSPGRIRIEQVAGNPATSGDVQSKIAAAAPLPGMVIQYPDVHAQINAWLTTGEWLKEMLRSSAERETTARVTHDNKAADY